MDTKVVVGDGVVVVVGGGAVTYFSEVRVEGA